MSECDIIRLREEIQLAIDDYWKLVREFEEVKQYYEAKIAVAKRDLKKQ